MTIEAIDHVNIRTADVLSTSQFFADILDMTIKHAPGYDDLSVAAWLYDDDDKAAVHIGDASISYPWEMDASVQASGSGRVHHVAFRCNGYEKMTQKLMLKGIEFNSNTVAEANLRQLFITDPNGILLELNFFGD